MATVTEHHPRFWRREFLVVLLTLAGVVGAEGVFRQIWIQRHFWATILARMGLADWAMREPAQLRYESLHAEDNETSRSGISIFGSSQSAANLDRKLIAIRLDRPVYRRALNGMLALETCSAQYLLAMPQTKTAIFYMSPMDIAGSSGVRANWMRSLISPQSWADVVHVLGPDLAWENRGPLTELAFAAHIRLWAFRDGARWLLFNLAGRTPPPRSRISGERSVLPQGQPFAIHPAYVEASLRGYRLVFENLKRWGFDIVVFQGEVRPAFRQQISDEYWLPMEERIAFFLREQNIRYVLLDEYRPNIGSQDWADNTHMNENGRRKLTTAVVSILQSAGDENCAVQ